MSQLLHFYKLRKYNTDTKYMKCNLWVRLASTKGQSSTHLLAALFFYIGHCCDFQVLHLGSTVNSFPPRKDYIAFSSTIQGRYLIVFFRLYPAEIFSILCPKYVVSSAIDAYLKLLKGTQGQQQ